MKNIHPERVPKSRGRRGVKEKTKGQEHKKTQAGNLLSANRSVKLSSRH